MPPLDKPYRETFNAHHKARETRLRLMPWAYRAHTNGRYEACQWLHRYRSQQRRIASIDRAPQATSQRSLSGSHNQYRTQLTADSHSLSRYHTLLYAAYFSPHFGITPPPTSVTLHISRLILTAYAAVFASRQHGRARHTRAKTEKLAALPQRFIADAGFHTPHAWRDAQPRASKDRRRSRTNTPSPPRDFARAISAPFLLPHTVLTKLNADCAPCQLMRASLGQPPSPASITTPQCREICRHYRCARSAAAYHRDSRASRAITSISLHQRRRSRILMMGQVKMKGATCSQPRWCFPTASCARRLYTSHNSRGARYAIWRAVEIFYSIDAMPRRIALMHR